MCRDCAINYLRTEIKSSRFPIKCFIDNCENHFTHEDLGLVLTEEELEQLDRLELQYILSTSQNWFPCLNPVGCEGGVFYDPSDQYTRFTCDGCKMVWCVRCKDAFHENETCTRYLKWKKLNGHVEDHLEKLIKQGKVKLCPFRGCGTPSQKNGGCNHLVCNRSKGKWCWGCGNSRKKCSCKEK